MIYLDTSAIVKLIAPEPETDALESWISQRGGDLVTSQLAVTEATRAIRRRHGVATSDGPARLGGLALQAGARTVRALPATEHVLTDAGRLDPPAMRSLDAIHVATALALGPVLAAFVTYDERQAEAASTSGLTVATPR